VQPPLHPYRAGDTTTSKAELPPLASSRMRNPKDAEKYDEDRDQ
jgi:hypothetical protein